MSENKYITELCNRAITKAWQKQQTGYKESYESDTMNLLRYIVYLADEAPNLITEIYQNSEQSTFCFPYMNEPESDIIYYISLKITETNCEVL